MTDGPRSASRERLVDGYFARRTIADLAADLRARRVSSRDLVGIALEEAERSQSAINAFVTIDRDGACATAAEADRELAYGVDRGVLHGVPMAVKDMIDVRGQPTTAGSRHFANRIADRDAGSVARLRRAGAIPIGKTTTHEFANGPTGDRSSTGPTRNPHALGYIAGGSSSGSAAAVAAGIVPFALGTDTGGSVRIPAACCGVVGVRPTQGAIESSGVYPLAESMDTVGVLAGAVADARAVLSALIDGFTARTEMTAVARVGWLSPQAFHPAQDSVVRSTRDLVASLVTDEVDLPGADELLHTYRVIQGREAHGVHAERLDSAPELYGSEVRARLEMGGAYTNAQLSQALSVREQVRVRAAQLLATVDFLVLPTIPFSVPALFSRRAIIGDREVDVPAGLLALTAPWSLLGLPAVSIPAADVDGVPVGLQIVGRAHAEAELLSFAAHLETQRPERG
ncbi:amidase [Rhodococcus sp. P1Y]|uniref:amidase n=1 Tax=Rhodococcus sp. P1Y TaxID=1302308 RepID=UPI0019141888|nr:amidase [Rhodococcus sp. P1Y]